MKKIISDKILAWYDKNRRSFPWRETLYTDSDLHAYHTLVCEIMSQQTLLNVLLPKYNQFLDECPTINDLALCSDETLRRLWAGLGYYARARNLKKAALYIVDSLKNQFPKTRTQWLGVPGCGPYTSAIIASICYKDPSPAVDGNVIRVTSRLLAIDSVEVWKTSGQQKIYDELSQIISKARPGDFNQAFMDLGAMVCKKQNPNCDECPLQSECKAFKNKCVQTCPPLKPRKQDVEKNIYAVIMSSSAVRDDVFLVKRSKGFLKNTKGFLLFTETDSFSLEDLKKNFKKLNLTAHVSEKSFSHKITNNKITTRTLTLCGTHFSKSCVKDVLDIIYGSQSDHTSYLVKKDSLNIHISSSLDQKVAKILS